ncbi:hypothetical protein MPHASIOC01_003031 [Mangrovibacter phragmitis]
MKNQYQRPKKPTNNTHKFRDEALKLAECIGAATRELKLYAWSSK